jgi:hypothetical protein
LIQILNWKPLQIQEYAGKLKNKLVKFQSEKGLFMDSSEFSANHLFSLPLSPDQDLQQVKHLLEQEKVMVSVRGTNIRVSINVFNEDQDLNLLMELLDS